MFNEYYLFTLIDLILYTSFCVECELLDHLLLFHLKHWIIYIFFLFLYKLFTIFLNNICVLECACIMAYMYVYPVFACVDIIAYIYVECRWLNVYISF